ncbi:MAG: hypothetical protein M0Z32_09125 [Actinomycetota bacterium]|jgi:hypothetical protein|nr:hypothetical protein [Actinomycetota bacterium]MCL6093724.1 hypothetical protein [Actinomycetota bacterium]MDA8167882.1 hypothetical protein [Actinomycetota bacterium]
MTKLNKYCSEIKISIIFVALLAGLGMLIFLTASIGEKIPAAVFAPSEQSSRQSLPWQATYYDISYQ